MSSAIRTTVLALTTLAAALPSAWAREYAPVISSTPIVAAVPVPQQQCVDQPVAVQQPVSGAGPLVAGLLGAAVGNQIGSGAGRALATGIGFVAGSAIAAQAEARAQPPVMTTARQCQTVTRYENRTIGYDVVYDFHGEQRHVQMAQPPGERIAVDVQVTPVDAAPPAVVSAAPSPAEMAVPAVVPAPVYPAYTAYPAVPVYRAYPAVWPSVSIGIGGVWGHGGGHHWR